MLYDPEMRLNGGSVIAHEPCATAAGEASLLCSVLDLYSKGALPGGLQDISEDMVRRCSRALQHAAGLRLWHAACAAGMGLTATIALRGQA
jgi:hypothetical protein